MRDPTALCLIIGFVSGLIRGLATPDNPLFTWPGLRAEGSILKSQNPYTIRSIASIIERKCFKDKKLRKEKKEKQRGKSEVAGPSTIFPLCPGKSKSKAPDRMACNKNSQI